MYLAAGLRLLQRASADEPEDEVSPLFAWLSRRRIVDETKHEPSESGLPRTGSINGIRDRWDPHRDFIADLVMTALGPERWAANAGATAQLVEALSRDTDLAEGVHGVAAYGQEAVSESGLFRVHLLATIAAEEDETLQSTLVEGYEAATQTWLRVYADAMQRLGLRWRVGFDAEKFCAVAIAMNEGLGLRLLVDPDQRPTFLDPDGGHSVLGTALIALLAGTVDFDGDGLTVEQYLNEAVRRGRAR